MSQLEQFGHGGDLVTAEAHFGILREKLLDFSANINPLGPPDSILQSIRDGLRTIVHYPDPGHRSFRRVLADKLEISDAWILPGNGAAECMALAILALAPRKVGVVYPCFSEYEMLAKQFGAEIVACYTKEDDHFKASKDDLYPLFVEAELVFIGSPNNPTGTVYSKDELIEMAEWCDHTDTYLVVDEAFLHFVEDGSKLTLLDELERFPRVMLIRSLTKMFAIPGLRLGYTIAHPALIDRMKQKQVTWSVNGLALLAGEQCVKEEHYEQETRQLIRTERAFLSEQLQRKLGWSVMSSAVNYLLVRCTDEITADELQQKMGYKGILIRNCSMYPGLSPYHFRIAVRTREENEQLLTVMLEVRDTVKDSIKDKETAERRGE